MIESAANRTGIAACGRLAALGLLLACAACQSSAEHPPRGDNAEFARQTSAAALMAASCAGCHAGGTTADAGLPAIDALTPSQIAEALRGFRDGSLPGTLMPRIARGYDDAQIELVSEYLGR
jgi:cytochrome c553